MANHELDRLRQRVLDYADTFIFRADIPDPHILKKEHTLRVTDEILDLARELNLPGPMTVLAQAIALLHDLGRFRQFETYGTFQDRISENHARLALKEIKTLGILEQWTDLERRMIMDGVLFHNAAEVPADRDLDGTLLMKLIRDADKLDIWRVLIDHYSSAPSEKNRYITLGFEDNTGFSGKVVEAVFKNSYVRSDLVNGLADLKLMQMSWVFDLNFPESVARIRKRGYIDAIASTLPASDILSGICHHINAYMETNEVHEINY
ncbi:MAG: HD domain-containing protein [Pseudomonadota bacterium]